MEVAPARLTYRLAGFSVVAQRGAIGVADTAASGHDTRGWASGHAVFAEKLGDRRAYSESEAIAPPGG